MYTVAERIRSIRKALLYAVDGREAACNDAVVNVIYSGDTDASPATIPPNTLSISICSIHGPALNHGRRRLRQEILGTDLQYMVRVMRWRRRSLDYLWLQKLR